MTKYIILLALLVARIIHQPSAASTAVLAPFTPASDKVVRALTTGAGTTAGMVKQYSYRQLAETGNKSMQNVPGRAVRVKTNS